MNYKWQVTPVQRIMANSGLFSPPDVDEIIDDLDEAMASLIAEIDKLRRMNRECEE